MFQLAKEVDELLAGNEEKFKGNVASVDTPSAPLHKAKVVKAPALPTMPSASHIDAVPQATPINRNRVVHKKVKTKLQYKCVEKVSKTAIKRNQKQKYVL